jgi:hypothetical protein
VAAAACVSKSCQKVVASYRVVPLRRRRFDLFFLSLTLSVSRIIQMLLLLSLLLLFGNHQFWNMVSFLLFCVSSRIKPLLLWMETTIFGKIMVVVVVVVQLRTLGIPSPSSILRKRSRTNNAPTPLFQTTVLLRNDTTTTTTTTTTTPRDGGTREELHQDHSNDNGHDGRGGDNEDADDEQDIFNFRRGISPTTTPVQIILSRDSSIGVAQILPTTMPPSWWRVSSTTN